MSLEAEHEGIADGVVDGVRKGWSGQVAGAAPGERQGHPEHDMHADQLHHLQRQRQTVRDGEMPQPPQRRHQDGGPPAASFTVVMNVLVERATERDLLEAEQALSTAGCTRRESVWRWGYRLCRPRSQRARRAPPENLSRACFIGGVLVIGAAGW